MSSQWVWVVGAIIIIAIVLFWSGMVKVAPDTQGAALITSGGDDAALQADLATIDGHMSTLSQKVAAFGSAPTRTQISNAKKSVSVSSSVMKKLLVKLQSRSTNNQANGGAKINAAVVNDLMSHLSNATSNSSAADKNSAAAPSDVLVQVASATQIKTAKNDIIAARANFTTLFTSLGVK